MARLSSGVGRRVVEVAPPEIVPPEVRSRGAQDTSGEPGLQAHREPVFVSRGPIRSLLETTKPGIVRLVTITSMVGFAMAAVDAWQAGRRDAWDWAISALVCMVGTALSAGGANAINQYMERTRDAAMHRTAKRPLPTGRVTPRAVLWFGIAAGVIGVGLLWAMLSWLPALVSLVCLVVYVAIYTPMKPLTTWSTFVGAIPGALPPLIGWTAASPGLDALAQAGGWLLFAIMFVWQIPHFYAIAWMYREDYARGGYRVLPVIDPEGRRTARGIALWTALLLPLTLAPFWLMNGAVGYAYLAAAALTGGVFAWMALRVVRERTREAARGLFFTSIVQLPVLFAAMVGEAIFRVAMQ